MPNWCTNILTINTTSDKFPDVWNMVINSETNAVDFELVDPIPVELMGAYSFDPENKKIIFRTTNTARIGLQPLKYLKLDSTQTRVTSAIKDDDRIDPDKTLEEVIQHLAGGLSETNWIRSAEHDSLFSGTDRVSVLGELLRIVSVDHEKYCLEVYGFTSWYDWSIEHWSTKWNSYESQILETSQPETELSVQFETAWSPPVGWFQSLVKRLRRENIEGDISLEYGEPGMMVGGRLVVDVNKRIVRTSFTEDELSEFLYGDSDYLKHEEWYEASEAIEDTPLVEDDFSDHLFTDEELEADE